MNKAAEIVTKELPGFWFKKRVEFSLKREIIKSKKKKKKIETQVISIFVNRWVFDHF